MPRKQITTQDWPPNLGGPYSFKRWLFLTPCPDSPCGDLMGDLRYHYDLMSLPEFFPSLPAFLQTLDRYGGDGRSVKTGTEAWGLFVAWRHKAVESERRATARLLRAHGLLPPTKKDWQRNGVLPPDPPTRADYKRVGMIPLDYADLKKNGFIP